MEKEQEQEQAHDPSPRSGKEPEGYVGIKDHGPTAKPPGARGLRLLASGVWGGVAAEVTSEHACECGYCGSSWPNSVCMDGGTHPGMDISMGTGTPLYAAQGGTVEFAGWGEYYRPHHVDLRTEDGSIHIYAHMWSVADGVSVGAWVDAGTYLGDSGEQTVAGTMTPDGTGGHLHIEMRDANGCAYSPETILAAASSGGTTVASFEIRDRISVTDGPLNLRDAPSTSGAIVKSLKSGAELCVRAGPEHADGYAWYRVRVAGTKTRGWIAGQFCGLVTRGGC